MLDDILMEKLRNDRESYREYLESGGKPITIAVTIHPGDIGFNVNAEIKHPFDSVLLKTWAEYLLHQIKVAVQPPKGGDCNAL